MKFRVTKIAVAVATGLGVSVVGMNAAQADEILFPYIVNSSVVSTILTVINDDDASVRRLHYRYYYKTVDDNTRSCDEVDYRQPTSPNDVVTFDTGGVFGDANGVLFEPAANQVNARYDRNFAVFRNIKPVIAFGIVDNNDAFKAGVGVSGEAIVLEFNSGSAWGYKASNHAGIYSLTGNSLVLENQYDFSDRVELDSEILVPRPAFSDPDEYWVPIGAMPFLDNTQGGAVPPDQKIVTRFFVTPVSTFQLRNDISSLVGLRVNDPDNAVFDVMYDRDENPISGQTDKRIVCVGRVGIEDLISTAARQFLPYGGWTNFTIQDGQATVFKLEFNPSNPAALAGTNGPVAVKGTFNNALHLRKGIREGTARAKLLPNIEPLLATYYIAAPYDYASGPDSAYVVDNNSPFPVLTWPAGVAAAQAVGQVTGRTLIGYPGFQPHTPDSNPLKTIQGHIEGVYANATTNFANPLGVEDAIRNERYSVRQ